MQQSATIGQSFLVSQNGSISTVRHWVGILNSPNGWQESKVYSQDYVRQELVYGGRTGNTIDVSYREFRGGYAAPAFYQSVKYDLGASSRIRFQNFSIDVLQADNQTIVYKIVSDR
ncbi:hypothetical protein Bphy_6881 (plasmid) [Paraburkholderia phymatum STM815]|uniref:Uncharacterized protein n=1 Tax=Paraburkholderia phymatum (strain DSM 17167 / CIP 108236 / LMG 21445 / STM815) TaxID=391038 RepID=B2JTI9_PARP8|nr:hypothetical protein Bphy_6881 [Paraburkholderia phymatum STM815]